MTIGEYLTSLSSIATGTAEEHIKAIKTAMTFVQSISADIKEERLEANIVDTLTADLQDDIYRADLIEENTKANITETVNGELT